MEREIIDGWDIVVLDSMRASLRQAKVKIRFEKVHARART